MPGVVREFVSDCRALVINEGNEPHTKGSPAIEGHIHLISRWSSSPCSGELRTQKLKSHLVRTQSLNVLPLKPGVGLYLAIHATLTARDITFAYFYPSGPFTCAFFPKPLPIFLCWLWLTHGSCVGPQNKIGHTARSRSPF